MAENKAIIPLYLNNDIINNLFTVVVQEFVQSRTVNTKDQVTINYRGPMSEFSQELFGKYVQGEVNVQLVNEFSKQKTQVTISKDIEVFIHLRNLLFKNNLLREISINDMVDGIHENDFIIVNCKIMKNPIFYYVENLINKMEMQNIFGNIKAVNSSRVDVLTNLKGYMDSWKSNNCMKCVTTEFCNPKSRFIVPIDPRYNINKFDYTGHCRVNIMGKVIKCINGNDIGYMDLFGCDCLEFINEPYFSDFMGINSVGNSIKNFSNKYISNSGNMIEILPIAIFL
ncbi:hypothetical protein [Clostridium sp.]|jgi:hypothetical protein|uniref:DUF6414 family protein n=1 Tax=Clostridium sp. TaxID=1506 RepID=UPI00258CB2D2|nr:hypothetical protein [Clostridium sp.]MDF2503893.1 hypothetical protein [Clostridium sp.]